MILHATLMLSLMTCCSLGARILALVPYNSRSHNVVMAPLFQELSARGHQVTVVSSFPRPNYRDLDLSKIIPPHISKYTLETVRDKMPNLFKTARFICEIDLDVSEKMMTDDRVFQLLNEKFDLVITEIFGSDLCNYFAYKMRAPVIGFVTSAALPWIADRTGLPDNPSYIPNYFMEYGTQMNLFQRIYNTLTLVYAKVAYYYNSELPTLALAQDVFDTHLPAVEEVNRRTSLVFVNSHVSLTQSRPFPPNVIEVGGIHIQENQSLPQDFKQILDSSTEGAVLLSFGSLVKVSSLPPQVIRMFLNVLGTLPHRVIFKYEEKLADVPSNVIVRAWLPQSAIVAHPNLVAVITHGGLASTVEAVHYAKPLVGVPFFSDQYQNVKNLVRRGAARILELDGVTEAKILEAVKAVLFDPRYRENMERLSWQFRDRPMTALQSAVYWTEYVIRHKGAPHLKPASVDLPLYQYLLLDVIAVLLLPLFFLFYIIYFFFFRAVHLSPNDEALYNTKKTN